MRHAFKVLLAAAILFVVVGDIRTVEMLENCKLFVRSGPALQKMIETSDNSFEVHSRVARIIEFRQRGSPHTSIWPGGINSATIYLTFGGKQFRKAQREPSSKWFQNRKMALGIAADMAKPKSKPVCIVVDDPHVWIRQRHNATESQAVNGGSPNSEGLEARVPDPISIRR
uniref:Secreted protein n=1 Tax=Panagrellus redivivus TaxID=6233 RepID=A0A7E4VWT3_PANRE